MVLTIHQLNENDIPSLVELPLEVGWDYDEAEMKAVLASGIVYGHKTPEGTVVSSSAVIPYKETAALGLVIVRKDYRRRGLAREAVQACLDILPADTGVMLFATDEGKPLYRELGFEEAGRVYKYIAQGQEMKKNSTALPNNIEGYKGSDWESVKHLDREAFGEGRDVFLHHRLHQAHLVKVRIDLTAESRIITSMLEQYGFEKHSEPPMMKRGPWNAGTRNRGLYAIASQIFG